MSRSYLSAQNTQTYLRRKVLAPVEIFEAESVVSYELDILILGDIALGVISNKHHEQIKIIFRPILPEKPDSVHHSYPDILNRSQEILVSNEISPDSAAVGATDVLREMVQEHSIHPARKVRS